MKILKLILNIFVFLWGELGIDPLFVTANNGMEDEPRNVLRFSRMSKGLINAFNALNVGVFQ